MKIGLSSRLENYWQFRKFSYFVTSMYVIGLGLIEVLLSTEKGSQCDLGSIISSHKTLGKLSVFCLTSN